jgi:hypothetical protein
VTRSTSDGTCLSVVTQQSVRLSHAMCTGATQTDVAPHRHRTTRLSHESRQGTWRDSFMSHVNWTDVTQRGQILKISFSPVHFSSYLKRDKIQKKYSWCPSELEVRAPPNTVRRDPCHHERHSFQPGLHVVARSKKHFS